MSKRPWETSGCIGTTTIVALLVTALHPGAWPDALQTPRSELPRRPPQRYLYSQFPHLPSAGLSASISSVSTASDNYCFSAIYTFLDDNDDDDSLTTTATSCKFSADNSKKLRNCRTKPRPNLTLFPTQCRNRTCRARCKEFLIIDGVCLIAAYMSTTCFLLDRQCCIMVTHAASVTLSLHTPNGVANSR